MFVYLQLLFVGFWIAANLHLVPSIQPWDQSFVILAMIASVEAIFLSTFVMQPVLPAVASREAPRYSAPKPGLDQTIVTSRRYDSEEPLF